MMGWSGRETGPTESNDGGSHGQVRVRFALHEARPRRTGRSRRGVEDERTRHPRDRGWHRRCGFRARRRDAWVERRHRRGP
ncbi:hypothetical protein FRIGORI9N_430033 [Frigoribacterium sp. 9N]|nr:hypothetical protein FRIGORI9N_430033 [Frigoribacterium sp. 9N]